MHKSFNKVIKSQIVVSIFSFIAVVLLVSGVTYSLFQIDKENTTNQTVAIGNLSATISSIDGAVLLNDLYPKLKSELNEEDKIYKFTIENNGDYDLQYSVYLKDATEAFLANSTEYSDYKIIGEDYYKYINFILDNSEEVLNLSAILNSNKQFVLFKGILGAGRSEDHQIQFFIDKGDTTATGAPNDIAGSIMSLDIYLDASAYDGTEIYTPTSSQETLAKLGQTVKTDTVSFSNQEPKPTAYTDTNFNTEAITKDMSNEGDLYFTYGTAYTINATTGLYTLSYYDKNTYENIYSTLAGKYISSPIGEIGSTANYANLPNIFKVVSATSTELTYIPCTRNITYDASKSGIYELEDNYGRSFYYRGAVENNYVKFAGFYWRILRVNGNGTLRVVYDGTKAYRNGLAYHDRIPIYRTMFNSPTNDAKYAGYMYGSSTPSTRRIMYGEEGYEDSANALYNEVDSNMKTALDNWYAANIAGKSDAYYVSDTMFCNDRSFATKNTGLGYGTSLSDFGAPNRIGFDVRSNPSPSFKCDLQSDRFTVKDTKVGNGALTYPVGTFTADEYTAAGARYGTSSETNGLFNPVFYLFRGNTIWTMTPGGFESSNAATGFFIKIGSVLGGLGNDGMHSLVPVINLSLKFVNNMHGDGTMDNPYRVD